MDFKQRAILYYSQSWLFSSVAYKIIHNLIQYKVANLNSLTFPYEIQKKLTIPLMVNKNVIENFQSALILCLW